MRKMISFKIENLSEKERQVVDAWADGQSNIQQSLANVVMHIVGLVGNADVMDFDVQRKLHTLFAERSLPIAQVKSAASPANVAKVPTTQDDVLGLFEDE